jgi:hypothetical protein
MADTICASRERGATGGMERERRRIIENLDSTTPMVWCYAAVPANLFSFLIDGAIPGAHMSGSL